MQRIFDFFVYPYQWQLIAISKNLRLFFNKHFSNSIKFWNCPSGSNWPLHTSVDSDIKKFNLILLFPCKMLWDFNKKEECNNIIKTSRWHFKHDFKGKHFLDFLDNELHLVILLYIKEGPWIKYFGHSNLLCARVTHTITNHAPIGGYHLRFFPMKILVVYINHILSKHNTISSITIGGSTNIWKFYIDYLISQTTVQTLSKRNASQH